MPLGLLCSGLTTFFLGFSESLMFLSILWIINNWFQSMGWPPVARMLTHWFAPKELGIKWAYGATSHQVGGAITLVFTGYLVADFGWRSAFFVPAIIAVIVALVLGLMLSRSLVRPMQAAVIISQKIADTFKDRVYPGGLTYSGHPLACAAAVASINIFKEEKIIENARMLGETVIGPELEKLKAKHPSVGDVRGVGVFWAIELVRNRETRKPLVPFNAAGADAKPMLDFAAECKKRGLWPFTHFNRTHVVPPCNATPDEVREGIAIIDEALTIADSFYEG
mgnify:CR=1 FL=1